MAFCIFEPKKSMKGLIQLLNLALDGVDREVIGNVLGLIGKLVDALDEVTQLGLVGKIKIRGEDIADYVVKRTMRVPTAVPKTFAASLAPSDQPRNSPLVRKKRTVRSIAGYSGRLVKVAKKQAAARYPRALFFNHRQ